MSVCAQCNKPLEVEVETYDHDEEDAQMGNGSSAEDPLETVPDDVCLACGDHFHWECLLEAYELSKCPKCFRDVTAQSPVGASSDEATPRILVDLNNEGGMQRQIDIFPILKEETYLRAYPDERKPRAFLEFCREGDYRAIVDLLHSCKRSSEDGDVDEDMDDEDMEPSKSPDEILRYQDPIGDMQSGLHAAAANGHREVAWLLLLLASDMPDLDFPPLVYQEAAALGVMREDQTGKVDIRSLRDAHDRSAEDIAKEAGVIWSGWIGNQRLSLP